MQEWIFDNIRDFMEWRDNFVKLFGVNPNKVTGYIKNGHMTITARHRF